MTCKIRVGRGLVLAAVSLLMALEPLSRPLARTVEPGFEYGVDRPGSDFFAFELPSPNPAQCAAACAQDGRCRAWTYVKPGVQGALARCWLKNAVPPPVSGATFAISGVTRPDAPPPVATTPPAARGARGCNGFAGTWETNFGGRVVMTQNGDQVSFTTPPATQRGTVAGNSLRGEWVRADNGLRGTFQLQLATDRRSFTGEAATAGWGARWNGTCVK